MLYSAQMGRQRTVGREKTDEIIERRDADNGDPVVLAYILNSMPAYFADMFQQIGIFMNHIH